MDYKLYLESQKLWELNNEDITANKHHGNEESREANERANYGKEQQRMEVLECISRFPGGCTMKEVAAMMGKPFNAVSGRGSELKKAGQVEKTGETRDGSAVLRVVSRILSVEELIEAMA